MKLAIISFTKQGAELCLRLKQGFEKRGEECAGYLVPRYQSPEYEEAGLIPLEETLEEWTGRQFLLADGIVFIGAAGIAVRAAAPYIKSKAEDPAVVVMDAAGRFAVSLLSGHLGGANELAAAAAKIAGATPVITTATDINRRFAVDEFARRRGMELSDLKLAKYISAALLDNRRIGVSSDFLLDQKLPEGLIYGLNTEPRISFTYREAENPQVLRLIPKCIVIGIGCRKGISEETLEAQALGALKRSGIALEAVRAVASIDLKKEEEGLLAFAEKMGVPAVFFTAEELLEAKGVFTESDFVTGVTGVGNVCERAAVLAFREDGQNELLVAKQAGEGVTVALGLIRKRISFGGTDDE